MQELTFEQVEEVSGGSSSPGQISPSEGATLILGLGAMGGPATFAFAFPIALALYYIS